MSGFEIVGVALALMPLVISVAEDYNKVHGRFTRYRKFSAEAKEFQSLLKIQKTIFREECRLLICQVVGEDEASEMLKEPLHPTWLDPVANEALSKYMGETKDACAENVRLIAQKLQAIEQEGDELDKVINPTTKQSGCTGDKAWRKKIGKKLRFTFSASSLDQNLAKLRDLNDSLRRLTDQLSRVEERRSYNPHSVSRQQRQDIEKFRLVQTASALLYNALGTACTKHTEHAAHLCLQPSLTEGCNSNIRFSVSFSQPGDPIWFAVESIINQSLSRGLPQSCNTLSGLTKTIKPRDRSPSPELCSAKKRKAVRFRSPSPPRIISISTLQIPPRCLKPNFCTQIKKCFPRNGVETNYCLGLLDESDICKHLVYLPSTPSIRCGKRSTSLDQLFTLLSQSQAPEELPIFERLRFAKLLSTAVLQFHATPWLNGSWRSQDVLFFDSDTPTDSKERPPLTSPYMNVSVKSPNGALSRAPTFPSRAFAPNPLIFGLGVMLLELAFEAPLRRMQQDSDLQGGQEDRHTEFFTAKRLNRTASTPMGPRYSEIVRKCLQCDFGRGDDLSKPELQEGFYREVVCELGKLEDKFKELQLGD